MAVEQTGFSSGTPNNDDDVCFARERRDKNFLIKSLTCAADLLASLWRRDGERKRERWKKRARSRPMCCGEGQK